MDSSFCNEKLFDYVDKGCMTNIRILLRKGADPTTITSNGMTAVGLAAMKGNYGILSRLLCETDATKQKKIEMTEYDSTPEGMEQLEWDEEIDSRYCFSPDKEWLNLYTYYAQMWENIGEMLTVASKLRDPHCLDHHHYAPIHYAAKQGHMICVKLLLDYKCPVDLLSHSGHTPLHFACQYEHKTVVKLLLRNKSDVNKKTFKTEDSPLLISARNGNTEILGMLLDAGANIDQCNTQDITPLMTAILAKNIKAAKLLIAKGANVNLQDREGFTALYFAVHAESSELAQLLLDNGARIIQSHNLLHFSVAAKNDELVMMLVKAGENINSRDLAGLTALEKLISFSNEKMVLFLLENGSNLTLNSTEIFMIINIEKEDKYRKMVNLLTHFDCDIDTIFNADTPLTFTIRTKQYSFAKILIEEGANVNVRYMIDTLGMMCEQIPEQFIKFLVFSGLGRQEIKSIAEKSQFSKNGNNIYDTDIYKLYKSRTLQQLCRIKIRELLRVKMKAPSTYCTPEIKSDYFASIMENLIIQTGLPKPIVNFIYKFVDLEQFEYI